MASSEAASIARRQERFRSGRPGAADTAEGTEKGEERAQGWKHRLRPVGGSLGATPPLRARLLRAGAAVRAVQWPALPSLCSSRRDTRWRSSKRAWGSWRPCPSRSSDNPERKALACPLDKAAQPVPAARRAEPLPAGRRMEPCVSFAVLKIKAGWAQDKCAGSHQIAPAAGALSAAPRAQSQLSVTATFATSP